MNYIMTLGLAVLAIGILVAPAYAQTEPSPLKQLGSGIPLHEIQCNDGKVLLQKSDKPACVTLDSAERLLERGWSVPAQASISVTDSVTPGEMQDSADVDGGILKISDQTITWSYYGQSLNLVSELGPGSYLWPKFNVTFPEQARIGESFDIVVDYTYVIPDEDTQNFADPEEQCLPVEYCKEEHYFRIAVPTYAEYVNDDDAVFHWNVTDKRHLPHRTWNAYSLYPPFDNTRYLQETFTFVVNEPDIDYRYGVIKINFHGDDRGIIYFNAAQDGIVYFGDEKMQSLGEGPGQLLKLTPRSGPSPTSSPDPPWDGPPPDIWPEFIDYLLTYWPDADYRKLLVEEGQLKESWVNEFLIINSEELGIQSFAPALHWILPSAYGPAPTVSSNSNA